MSAHRLDLTKTDHLDHNLADLTTTVEIRITDVLEQLLNRRTLIRQTMDHRGDEQLMEESSIGHAQHALIWHIKRG